MQNHTFYMALAYGVSAVLLLLEVLSLWRRNRRLRSHQEKGL